MSVSLIDGHIDDDAMTDEQIIKALECCDCPTLAGCCECCFKGTDDCTGNLTKATIDLIKRQKAEIEMWKSSAELWEGDAKDLFISREQIKAEAIKEFAERLKGIERWTPTDLYVINNLVKEMVGE